MAGIMPLAGSTKSLTAQAFFGGVLVVIAMFIIVTMGEEKKVDSTNGN